MDQINSFHRSVVLMFDVPCLILAIACFVIFVKGNPLAYGTPFQTGRQDFQGGLFQSGFPAVGVAAVEIYQIANEYHVSPPHFPYF